jgi:YidC/Oxa1 family membrane protein insertase
MFVQQKLMSPASSKSKNKDKKQDDNPAAAMTQSMQYTMPIMFGFFSLQFQAGLSIYFVLSNLIGIGQGYYVRRVMQPEREASEKSMAARDMEVQSANGKKPAKARQSTASASSAYRQRQKSKRPASKRKRRSAKR